MKGDGRNQKTIDSKKFKPKKELSKMIFENNNLKINSNKIYLKIKIIFKKK